MKKAVCILLVTVMMLSLCACGSKEEETIRIGVVGPLTGEGAIFGECLTKCVQLLGEQQNEAGGVLGKKLEIMIYDNRDDGVETTNVARKAILNDKCVALIGTDSSTSTLALVEVGTANEVPVITHMATNSKVTTTEDGKVRPWAFRACMSDPQTGAVLGEYAVKECGYENIAIVYELGSDFSIGVMGEFCKAVENAGGTVVACEAYNTGDVDYRSVLTKVMNAGKFDALYIAAGYYKQIGLIAKQARELGMDVPFVSTEGCLSNDLFTIAGDAMEGTIFMQPVDIYSDKVTGYVNDFIEKWGYDPTVNTAGDTYLAYDAFKLLIGAIEKAGSADPKAIRDALENTTSMEGLTCTISFDPATHLVYRDVPIMRITNQDYEMIDLYTPELPGA